MEPTLSLDEELVRIDKFLEYLPKPTNLESIRDEAAAFCARHSDKPIALVTSGGTTVPLEHNTVRFIDNFSAGTRGSASSEYFLSHGYAVIFFYRAKSLEPFSRHINVRSLLNALVVTDGCQMLQICPEFSASLRPILSQYVESKENLHMVTFTTLAEYLHTLRELTLVLEPLKSRVMLYLAAAVSDFYIPPENMATHKIQSSEPLRIRFELVPKILRPLCKFWVPSAFVISFKLETDKEILLEKARKALRKYGHKLVIANELNTRKNCVTLVDDRKYETIRTNDDDGIEIELKIVEKIIVKHKEFMC